MLTTICLPFDQIVDYYWFGYSLDEGFKAAAWAWEVLEDPQTRHSGDTSDSSFGKAFNTKETIWSFYERPENRFRHKRFDLGMAGATATQPADAIISSLFRSPI